ncbi:MAG: efflux RND transporter permease subunit [Armatimonadetes bacterium]|nr:efflux RND transporter permease subunit [Armatimonadota bacterium]
MWLTRTAITRPIFIWMVLAAIMLLGIEAARRLPAELNPRVSIPTLTVTTVFPGAGPLEVEALVTKPLEDAVGSVNRVKGVYSRSQTSVSIISLDFSLGTNLDAAAAEVRQKVDAVKMTLPPEVLPPVVAKLDINALPILYIGLSSNEPISELRHLVDTVLKPQIARVPGVATVDVIGGEANEVHVEVNPQRLQQYGVTIEDVVNSLKAASHNVPAGTITQGLRNFTVQTAGAFTRLQDIRRTQIISMASMAAAGNMSSGANPVAPLTVGDVANVWEGPAKSTLINRVQGRESVSLVISKHSDANTVSVADGVKRKLQSLRSRLPADTQIVISKDDSITIRNALEDVDATLILGAILATAVVFLFLHSVRATVIVSIALPTSIVATFLVMYFAGFTLNQMTLLALSLSVGILIDDSIVVLENIIRHLRNGETPVEAAFNGRTEIGLASIALTLVDVVVFVPIAFMGGIVGGFFRQFGLTVVSATLFSLLVSFTITPMLASRWYRGGETFVSSGGLFHRFDLLYSKLDSFYHGVIVWALHNRSLVLAGGIALLVAAALFSLPSLGVEFLPGIDQGQIAITIEMPSDSSIAATDNVAREVEQVVRNTAGVRYYVTTVGEIMGGFGATPQEGQQYAQVNVRLLPRKGVLDELLSPIFPKANLRTQSDEQIATILRKKLRFIPWATIQVAAVRNVAAAGPPVQIELRGQSLTDLTSAATQLRERMLHLPGILDPSILLRSGAPEVEVQVNRERAAALNIPPDLVGATLRDAIEGNTDVLYREMGTDIPVHIQLAGVDRNDPNQIGSIPVGASNGGPVTIADVANIRYSSTPPAIDHVNGQREVTVTANLAPGYTLSDAEQAISERMADIPMQGITMHWGGEAEVLSENASYFINALILAVLLVYMAMASLFNSLLNPFVIMFTLPMAMGGALVALVISGESFSLVAMIGVIMLVGLMGRNAILLVDYTATLRQRGMNRTNALAVAGATRLRPILMTTIATILGMLPVALRIGRASELRAPMAIVVIGGLLVSTILTLIMIPVVYSVADDAAAWVRRKLWGGRTDTAL